VQQKEQLKSFLIFVVVQNKRVAREELHNAQNQKAINVANLKSSLREKRLVNSQKNSVLLLCCPNS
jgi:hypothetical protein